MHSLQILSDLALSVFFSLSGENCTVCLAVFLLTFTSPLQLLTLTHVQTAAQRAGKSSESALSAHSLHQMILKYICYLFIQFASQTDS